METKYEKPNFVSENKAKYENGKNALDSLKSLLDNFKSNGIIAGYEDDFNSSPKNDYKLYAPIIIKFHDGKRWAAFDTTSFRSDRFKQQHWDSFLLKSLYPKRFGVGIEKCYLVYPDSASEKDLKQFRRANTTVNNIINHGNSVGELDGVLSQTEFLDLVENESYSKAGAGFRSDKQGKNFESRLAFILRSFDNINKWNGQPLNSGSQYPTFKKILDKFLIPSGRIITSIKALTGKDIPKLPSGGNPKTDILIRIRFAGGREETYTVSCKKTSKDYVSAHEYKADDFIEALHITDSRLASLIYKFQEIGAVTKMTAADTEELTKRLSPYVRRLAEWVVTGRHGTGTPEQCASYIITYQEGANSTSQFSIYTAREYIDQLMSPFYISKGQLGTPFRWTYPSKKHGKSIQLKMPVI